MVCYIKQVIPQVEKDFIETSYTQAHQNLNLPMCHSAIHDPIRQRQLIIFSVLLMICYIIVTRQVFKTHQLLNNIDKPYELYIKYTTEGTTTKLESNNMKKSSERRLQSVLVLEEGSRVEKVLISKNSNDNYKVKNEPLHVRDSYWNEGSEDDATNEYQGEYEDEVEEKWEDINPEYSDDDDYPRVFGTIVVNGIEYTTIVNPE